MPGGAGGRKYGTGVATIDDVSRLARRLPEVTEGERHGNRTWFVAGPILAVRVEDLGEKEAVLAAHPADFFTIPHFDGYSAVLIQLPKVPEQALREAVTDGWLACAPPQLAREFLGRPS